MTPRELRAAFASVYQAEHGRLLRYLRRRVGPDEAPDLAQEAFARLLRCGDLERIESPAAYLSRITRNMLIDRARRKKRDCSIFFPFDENRDAASRAEQAWRIEAADLLRIYRQAVRAMPPKTRRVFVLHRLRHLPYKQVAEQLGISIATVEYHMMRALAGCRTVVGEHR